MFFDRTFDVCKTTGWMYAPFGSSRTSYRRKTVVRLRPVKVEKAIKLMSR